MESGLSGLTKLAAALFSVAAIAGLSAAEPQLPPSKRNAPKGQSIEFYPGGAPQLPRPTTRTDQLKNQSSPVGESPGIDPTQSFDAPPSALTPTKAFAEKMRREMDAKKNWMVPGAQDSLLKDSWLAKGLENEGKDEANPFNSNNSNSKPTTVLERFLSGADHKEKTDKLKGSNEDKNKSGRYDNRDKRDNYDDPENPYNDENQKEQKRGSDFDLHRAISSPQRSDAFGRRESQGALQPFTPSLGGYDPEALREREKAREAEATHAAEFQKIIQPRQPFSGGMDSLRDPINSAADLTRRELNPIMPRSSIEPSRSENSPFSQAQGVGAFRAPDSGMLGVAAPMTPSMSSGFGAPASMPVNPMPRITQPIIMEPPKRKFN